MLIAQRQHQPVIRRSRLQLEIERAAEPLSQREPPGLIDPRPERRMNHQLHAAGFVEEPFGHHGVLRRDRAQRIAAGANIRDGLFRASHDPWRSRVPASAIGSAAEMISSRSLETSSDSSRVRPGASPRQNGMVGAAP